MDVWGLGRSELPDKPEVTPEGLLAGDEVLDSAFVALRDSPLNPPQEWRKDPLFRAGTGDFLGQGLEIDMHLDRWAERIYSERDTGRGVATTVAGIAGLATYLYWNDWIVAVFVAIIMFPVSRISASAIHSRWSQSRQRSDDRGNIEEFLEKLGSEEKAVVQAFVRHGGSVITWGEFNRSPQFTQPGIESLINRGLVHTTVTADGMTEAFALDTKLFDYAQTVLPNEPV